MNERRWPAIGSRLTWLCLLAAFFGGQLIFWQDSSDPFAPVEGFWFKVFLSLGGLPFLASRWAELRLFGATWPARAAMAWVCWLWLSAFLAPAAFHADAFKTALEYSLYTLPFFVAAVATAAERRAFWWALLAGGLLAAGYGLFQHFGVDPWSWSTNFGGRPLGTIGNPNFFGGHLLLAWGLCLAGLLQAPPNRRSWWAAGLILLFLVMFFTITVGVWLGMAFSLLPAWAFAATPAGERALAGWGIAPRRYWRNSGIAAAVLLVLILIPPVRQRLLQFKDSKSNSVVNREMMWKSALSLWEQAPIQGAGLCSFRPLYPKLQAKILEDEKGRGWNYVVTWLPHENYLYWLCETGLIGLGLVLGFWGLCLVAGWRRAAQGEPLVLGAGLALAGLLGASFLNTFSNIPPTAVGAALCLGLLAASPVQAKQQKHQAALGVPLEAWVSALVLALLLGRAGGQELLANRFTRQGGRLDKAEDHAGAGELYQRAADLGIANFTQQAVVGVYFLVGEDLRQTGRLADAVESYKKDLAANPWAPEVHNMLGASLGQLGSATRRADLISEGAEHLRTAAWLNPGYTTALLNLGGSYMTLGNVSGAAEAWGEVLQYDPQNKDAQGYLLMLKAKK